MELQARSCTRSVKALLGAGVTTAGLFLSISSISLVLERPAQEFEPPLTFVAVPPPPPSPLKEITTPPLSSSFGESFKFDPTTASPPLDIPLEMLDIRLTPSLDGLPEMGISLERTFEVQKPEGPKGLMVFERDQVDEIPVWLFGPMPALSTSWQREDCDLQVLFIVNERGHTENIYVLDSTIAEFSEPVKNAIKRWTFKPARKDGKAVRIWVQQLVTYRPSSKSPFSL